MTDAVSDRVPDDPAVVDVSAMLLNWFRGVSEEKSGLRVGPHSSHSLSMFSWWNRSSSPDSTSIPLSCDLTGAC